MNMGARGPAPTPTAILDARGSWRAKTRDGEPELPALEFAPCPADLHGVARKTWNATAPRLIAMRVLTEADLDLLGDYCREREKYLYWHDWIRKHRSKMCNSPSFPPVVAMCNNARDAMHRIGAQLGLSPASRTRLRVDPFVLDAPATKLAEPSAKSRFFKGA